jgi:hypothetical protein
MGGDGEEERGSRGAAVHEIEDRVCLFDDVYTTCAKHDSESNKFSRAKNHRVIVRNLYLKSGSNLISSLEEIL